MIRGTAGDLPPDLRAIVARYAALPIPTPTPDDTVRLVLRLIAAGSTGTLHSHSSWWLMTRQRLDDLGRGRSRLWRIGWLLINLLGTDISYGVTLSDAQLLREWQQGSEEALQALVERHHAPLLAHVARLIDGMAQDGTAAAITDEAFARFIRDAPPDRYPQPVAPALYAEAHRVLWGSQPVAHHQAETPMPDGARAEPQEQRDQGDVLRAALTVLPVEERVLLSLYIGGKLSTAEMTAAAGIPPEAVMGAVVAALIRVRDQLKQIDPPTNA